MDKWHIHKIEGGLSSEAARAAVKENISHAIRAQEVFVKVAMKMKRALR